MCVCGETFAQNNYCAKPNIKTDAHYGSQVRNRLEARYPRINLEYGLATAIVIWPLTQPVTCKMGSYISTAMTRIKVASATSASFPIIPYTEMENGEKFSFGRNVHFRYR